MPGREPAPVLNVDLFPTILELADVVRQGVSATSLLRTPSKRALISEYPTPYALLLNRFRSMFPDWDSTPWERRLWTVRVGSFKYHASSDGDRALFDLSVDPVEQVDLVESRPELARELEAELEAWERHLAETTVIEEERTLSEEERRRLESLGYL